MPNQTDDQKKAQLRQDALDYHSKPSPGKISIRASKPCITQRDLSLAYTPGVAEPCLAIEKNPELADEYTSRANLVGVISNGTAVLGLGNIGAKAAIPAMEGKAMLFKRFAGIDAFPICLVTQDTDEIVRAVQLIAPVFGGINLEDISAPRSFEIESRLQDLGIPVFHDDQHGTAIVVLAAVMNAAKVVKKNISNLSVVINGAGAAGVAIARLLRCVDNRNSDGCISVNNLIVCDSKGIIHKGRKDLNSSKTELLKYSNSENVKGLLRDALVGADVFIGVSVGNLLHAEDIKTMAKDAIVFGIANPTPEIMPDEAYKGGAAIVGTGRSDFPNQVNNVLGFPGIFRGALDARAKKITPDMKLAAAIAIADCVPYPTRQMVIPPSLSEEVAWKVAGAVKKAALIQNELKNADLP